MNAIVKTAAANTFRAKAAGLFIEAANASLHALVDAFLRLSVVIEENLFDDADGYRKLNAAGEPATRARRVIAGAARARFGLSLEAFGRGTASEYGDF